MNLKLATAGPAAGGAEGMTMAATAPAGEKCTSSLFPSIRQYFLLNFSNISLSDGRPQKLKFEKIASEPEHFILPGKVTWAMRLYSLEETITAVIFLAGS